MGWLLDVNRCPRQQAGCHAAQHLSTFILFKIWRYCFFGYCVGCCSCSSLKALWSKLCECPMVRSKSGIVRICRLHMLLTLGLLCESGFRHRHFSRLNATEAEMIAAARNLALAAAAYQVAGAVLVSTQERSAAQNALLFARFGGVPGRIGPLWIARRPALRRQLLVVIRAVPVAGPLPDVARHVVESVRVGGKLRHRSDARESIRALVLEREMALVGVGHPLSLRMKVVSPGVEVPGEAAARGELPLGFRGQALAHPLGVG